MRPAHRPPAKREEPRWVCVGCKRELRFGEVAGFRSSGHGYLPVCHACREAQR